jgi:hypothetical protein
MNKKLIYLPIDIDVEWPDEAVLIDWFHKHKLKDTDYWEYKSNRHTWAMTSTCKEPKDWHRYDKDIWDNRRKEGENHGVVLHPGFTEIFPSLANCLKQLPFKQLTVSGMLYQMGEIPPHRDAHDTRNPTEPRRYTIYLTHPKHNTFYFSRDESGSKKIYPNLITPCFAFNNTDVYHGAEATNRPKIILTMAGILDNTAHEHLLEKSLKKYKDYALYV